MMEEFKSLVTEVLTPHASAILLDPEWGLPASKRRAKNAGLLLAYEKTGYDKTGPGRLPDLLDHWSARRLKEAGADCVKILLYYTPFDPKDVNDKKHAWVERIGDECRANDIPFFLEFVGYEEGADEKGFEYAKKKPQIVTESMKEFSKDRYGVDVLKVEVPVNMKVWPHGEPRKEFRKERKGAFTPTQWRAMNQTALITGASGGIGYELAKLFAQGHCNLVLVARSGDKLAQVADELQRQFGIAVKTIALDLSQALAPHFLFDQLRRERISIDILINNAGYGRFGEFADLPLEESLGQIQLNVMALTALTKLFISPMLERRSGKIMNVASTAGFQPGPLMAVYYATKAYVISFSEALANELKDKGVSVTCLCPGATDTGFQGRAGTEQTVLFKKMRPMDAGTVARDGYRGLMAGKTLVISGLRNRLLAESIRLAPRKLVTAISRKILDKAG